jgi:MFS-type transporter involved in bile tolerance (Atg22 family)
MSRWLIRLLLFDRSFFIICLFFLATTLVGLGLGPYMVGAISELSGSLRIGVLSLITVLT